MNTSVIVVPTPNPDAFMFKVEEALVHTGTFEGKRGEDLSRLPLAEAILRHTGTDLVLIAPRFITVRKRPEADWMTLRPTLVREIISFIDSGEMAVLEEASHSVPVPQNQIETRILELINEEIRPAIAQDGGDLEYLGFTDGVVTIRLIGACGSCPSAMSTLKMGIERLLVEEIEEVLSVVQSAEA